MDTDCATVVVSPPCPNACGLAERSLPTTLDTLRVAACGNAAARQMPPLGFMELILTENCNLRCSYCWEKDKTPQNMPEQTAIAAIDFLFEQAGTLDKLDLLLFGGEPLLRFDLIRRVHAYATERARATKKTIAWSMTTNGTLLDEARAAWLAEHRVWYLLSLDGAKEDHDRHRKTVDGRGTFDVIAAKMPLLKRYQPRQGARLTITPATARNLRRNVETLLELGIGQFLIECAHGIAWTADDLATYEASLCDTAELYLAKRHSNQSMRMKFFEEAEPGKNWEKPYWGCGAGRGRFCVAPLGDLYGCSKLANITGARRGVLPMGNVFQGFTRIDNRRAFLGSTLGPREKCGQCTLQNVCAGGCPAVNAAAHGGIYEPDETACQISFVQQRARQYLRRRYAELFDDTSQPSA